MAWKQAGLAVELKNHILLVVSAYKDGQFIGMRAAAAAYNVPHSTITHWINCQKIQADISANYQKLKDLKEASLKQWILDIDKRGLHVTDRLNQTIQSIRSIYLGQAIQTVRSPI